MSNSSTNSNACQASDLSRSDPDIIPFGSVCLFQGASGVGKTIMQAAWCARWRDGKTICGHPTNRPTGLYYLAADRDWTTYARAFGAVGFPDIPHYTLAEDDAENPRAWKDLDSLDFFERCLGKLKPQPGALVFVDPVAPLFIKGDQNRARDVAVSLHWFRHCARRHGITLLCSTNVAKTKVEDTYRRPQDRVAGSGAFVAYSDTQIYMEPPPEQGGPTILGWTPRCAPAEEFKFQFDPQTHLFVPFIGFQDGDSTPDRLTQCYDLLPEEGTISRKEWFERVKERFPHSIETFKRDIRKMAERGLLVTPAMGLYGRRKPS